VAQHRRFLRALAPFLAVFPLFTCEAPTAPPAAVVRVEVVGTTALFVGRYGQLLARAYDARDQQLTGRSTNWSSSDTTVVTVDPGGAIIGRKPGHASVSATVGAVSGAATIAVSLVPITKVEVGPDTDSIFVGDTRQFIAFAYDSGGTLHGDRVATWSTSDTTRATVTAAGLVHVRDAGSFVVRATVDGRAGGAFVTGQYRLERIALPDSFTLRRGEQVIVLPDLQGPGGSSVSGRPIVWSSSNPTIVSVSQVGLVRALQVGDAHVIARSDSIVDSGLVRVAAWGIATVYMDRTEFVVEMFDPSRDTPTRLEVLVRDSGSFPVNPGLITWSVRDSTLASVTRDETDGAKAALRGLRPGNTFFFVRAGGFTDSAIVRVLPPAVSIRLWPDSAVLFPDQLDGFRMELLDSAGVSRLEPYGDMRAVASDPDILSVDEGLRGLHARREGTTRLIAWSQRFGLADTTFIRVVPRPPFWLHTDNINGAAPGTAGTTVYVLDSLGNRSGPLDIMVSSSDTTVLKPWQTFYPAVRDNVVLGFEARREGTATITVSSGSLYDITAGVINWVPATSVVLDPLPPFVLAGDTIRLHAEVWGADQTAARPRRIRWRVSDSTIATVSETGLLTTLSGGRVSIVAESEGKSDTVQTLVRSSAGLSITAVVPDTIIPNSTITMYGTGFVPGPTTVVIDGVPFTVTEIAPDHITMLAPSHSAFPCAPTRGAVLELVNGGNVTARWVTVGTAPRKSVTAGEFLLLEASDVACTDLWASGTDQVYVVLNTAPDRGAVTRFSLGRQVSSVTPAAAISVPSTTPVAPTPPPDVTPPRVHDQLHARLMESSKTIVDQTGPPVPLLRAARALPFRSSVEDTIGSLARVRIPRIEYPDFCSRYVSTNARIVYRGSRILILEDMQTPFHGSYDEHYRSVGSEFDATMFDQLRQYFGSPLALDSLLDGNGTITLLITPRVNQLGLAGFVTSCDFYPESVLPSSNGGEIMYVAAPTNPASGFTTGSGEYWRWLMRGTVMHEAKHVTAFAERLARGLGLEESWLEEGSAVLAEELWARSIYGTTWKGNARYDQTLFCDVRPTSACTGKPYAMFGAFAWLHEFARSIEARTPLGPVAGDDASFYGSAWALLRWTIDQYASDEAAFTGALTIHTGPRGLKALASLAGEADSVLLTRWRLSLYGDERRVQDFDRRLSFPSWNLQDIFLGMERDFLGTFTAQPLHIATLPQGGTIGSVRGASAAFYTFTANTHRELITLRGIDGGPPDPRLRLVIIRP
jgi:uncharacterized protein YjdB